MPTPSARAATDNYWRDDPAFQTLCELVASGQLVCFTGAGTSVSIVRKDGKTIPNWPELLKDIRRRLDKGREIPREQGRQLDALIIPEASGVHLIEAASVLQSIAGKRFERWVRWALTPALKQPKSVERSLVRKQGALLDLRPRGIVTVNVDTVHEAALKQRNCRWLCVDAVARDSEEKLKGLLSKRLLQPFLLKAHGTIGNANLVFTYRQYRDLLERRPVYQSFMQHLFTNFSFMFLGFGLSDLDFDILLQTVGLRFGSPIQRHVAFRKLIEGPSTSGAKPHVSLVSQRRQELAEATRLKLRFGIECLYVRNWADVPRILGDTVERLGRSLGRVIDQECVSASVGQRSRAHEKLGMLGDAGKNVAIHVLGKRIRASLKPAKRVSMFKVSEWIYSLGTLRPLDPALRQQVKETLFT